MLFVWESPGKMARHDFGVGRQVTLQPVWGGPVRSFGFGGLCWARRFPVAVAPKISKDRTQTDFVVIIVRVPLSIPTLPLYHRTSPRAVAHRIQFNTIQ